MPITATAISCTASRCRCARARWCVCWAATAPARPRPSSPSWAICKPRPGRILYNGRDIAALPPYAVARLGFGFVPQERGIFPSLTVRENLTVVRPRQRAASGYWTLQRIFDLFPNLRARERNLGFQLSGGEQQMLSIARALMLNPTLLLLDEPSEGLAPMIVQEIVEVLARLKQEGLAILLVEQNLRDRVCGRRPPPRHEQGRNLLHRQFGGARRQRVRAAQLSQRVSGRAAIRSVPADSVLAIPLVPAIVSPMKSKASSREAFACSDQNEGRRRRARIVRFRQRRAASVPARRRRL